MVATIYGAEKDVYLVGTQQLYTLGQKLETPAGDIYRYTEMGGTVGVVASLYQSSVPVANWDSTAITVALVVGDTTISFEDGGTAFVADEAAGGLIIAEETGDLGACYRVKSNGVTASNTTVMTLEDGVTVITAIAVAGGNVLTFTKNPWKDVIVHPSPQTAMPAGIQRVIIAANGFGWLQTRGPASYLVNGVHVVGNDLVPSNNVDGSLGNKRTTGTGTVVTTSIAITHNSGHTPVAADVSVEYTEDPTTAPETRWLDTFGATQFTVNVETDPSTSDLDFGWSVEVPATPVGVCMEVAPTADFGTLFLKLE